MLNLKNDNMKEIEITVPRDIRYISDWEGYEIPLGKVIVDKGVTGCGYTEYCLRNNHNIVLCSPRKLLLENKMDQHEGEWNILYLENDVENITSVRSLEKRVKDFISKCELMNTQEEEKRGIKIMVTYDSSHYVTEVLKELGLLDDFIYVIDEFQSIFLDSYFKAEVEFDFVEHLKEVPNVLYLSATPMLDKYLERVDEFKDLTFYRLDWSFTNAVENVVIDIKYSKTLSGACDKIIQSYLQEKYEMEVVGDSIVYSREAVLYFNSISEIISCIKRNKLLPSQVNIICANTKENKAKMKRLTKEFKEDNSDIKFSGEFEVGRIPLKGESNKMFTFCTKTAYIGADFYSDNARTFVFADPNIKSLSLDISLDLPQITGRQRDRSNPFKNKILVFYRTIRKKEMMDRDLFEEVQKQRKEATKDILDVFMSATQQQQVKLLKKFRSDIKVSQYSDDFVSISKKTGLPVYNSFIELANERAWEVSQKDYRDKISVTRVIEETFEVRVGEYMDEVEREVQDFLDNHFYSTGIFQEKMRMYCEFMDSHKKLNQELQDLIYFKIKDERFRKYYNFYGSEKIKSMKYLDKNLYSGMRFISKEYKLKEAILNRFKEGDRYTMKEAKEILKNIYRDLDLEGTPKAKDLENYFKLTKTKITKEDKSLENGFKLGKKED